MKKGEIPAVAFIVSAEDHIKVEYIGFTVFNNKQRVYVSPSNTQQYIEKQIDDLLGNSGRVKLVHPAEADSAAFREKIKREPNRSSDSDLTKGDISYISNWGKSNHLDYIAIVYPNVIDNFIYYAAAGTPAGKGVFGFGEATYLYAAFKIVLIDTASGQVTDTTTARTFRRVPTFSRKLSQEEIDKVTVRQEDGDTLTSSISQLGESLEEKLKRESHFGGADYIKLREQDILRIDEDIKPILSRNIKRHLMNLGFVAGERSGTLNDEIEPVKNLSTMTYQFP